MKKNILITLNYALFIFISLVASKIFSKIPFSNVKIPLAIGFILFIIGGIFVIISSKKQGLIKLSLSYLINAVALGLFITTWIIYKNINLQLIELIKMILVLSASLFLMGLLLNALQIKKVKTIVFIFIVVFILAAFIFFLVKTKSAHLATFGYLSIVGVSYAVLYLLDSKNIEHLFKQICTANLSIIFVGLIILIIISGEGLDFDLGSNIGSNNGKKKRDKKIY